MSEIKRNFTGGKMNKDLDERLVKNGEYRHAVNIQVRTTDNSGGNNSDSVSFADAVGNAGSAQNIQGNKNVGESWSQEWMEGNPYGIGATSNLDGTVNTTATETFHQRCIASIADEKKDKSYFFFSAIPFESGSWIDNYGVMKDFTLTV